MKAALTLILLLCASQTVLAQGRALHDASCMQCHASLTGGKPDSLYTRSDRKITSLSGLEQRVGYCMQAADVNWTEAEKRMVIEHLNSQFYRF